VFSNSSKSSCSKYERSKGWKPSSRSSGLSEDLSRDVMGLALAKDTSSWFGFGSTWRGSSRGVFSRM
jgi:hypothetical protein